MFDLSNKTDADILYCATGETIRDMLRATGRTAQAMIHKRCYGYAPDIFVTTDQFLPMLLTVSDTAVECRINPPDELKMTPAQRSRVQEATYNLNDPELFPKVLAWVMDNSVERMQ